MSNSFDISGPVVVNNILVFAGDSATNFVGQHNMFVVWSGATMAAGAAGVYTTSGVTDTTIDSSNYFLLPPGHAHVKQD